MHYAVAARIATLTFDRPERANALDVPAWHGMRDAFNRADNDEEVNVIILAGAGKHFCAGIDLSVLTGLQSSLSGGRETMVHELKAFISDLQDCITAIERCRKPVIAQIHGGCIGGGVDIITACDLRYCTHDAVFSVKEIDLGIVADLGTLQRLPHIISPGIAAELALTARQFNGKEAQAMGLVNGSLSSHDQLRFRVGQVADTIAAKPTRIAAAVKRALLHQREHTVGEGLAYVAGISTGLIVGDRS